MTSEVEQELLKAVGSKFKPPKKADRQDYLAALVQAVIRLSDAHYDELSDEADQWQTAAVEALNNKSNIPEFDGEGNDQGDETQAEEADPEAEEVQEVEAESEIEEEPEPPKAKKAKTASKPKKAKETDLPPPPYNRITGKKSKFGIYEGTKTAQAVAMYERGATVREVTEAMKGRHYNILKKLAQAGHKLEKLGGGVFKITFVAKAKPVDDE